jgi:hypothetical protein
MKKTSPQSLQRELAAHAQAVRLDSGRKKE